MRKKTLTLTLMFVGVLLATIISSQIGQAAGIRIDHDNATFTAYAMGGNGAGSGVTGHAIRPGDVAVHYYNCSPTRCQPTIPFGKYVYLKNGYLVTMPNGSGGTNSYSSLIVNDTGVGTSDPYWIDVYFGRWRRSTSESCSCPGVSGGTCLIGQTNSCTNAKNYGTQYRSYYYYDQ